MANFASDVRTRNFNFFIIIVGALATGHVYLKQSWAPLCLSVSGIVVSFFFFCLDLRMRDILKVRIDELDIIEPEVWKRAGIEGSQGNPRSGPIWFASHLWIDRCMFVLTGIASLVLLIGTLL